MAVFYKKMQRYNPLNKAIVKWYPVLRSIGVLKTKELAKLMSDETTMNPKEAEMAIYELVKILKRELKEGKTVSIDDFGTFMLTASTTGEDTEEAVSAGNITGLNIRFRPNADFKTEIAKAEIRAWK
ncbi:MAG: HU family DNA-binding protein [Prevotellaceae bacterium]|jgi:predicted histone-like DNA-binding protein|nr:HU family DNA-binding protein [Prevotellaceae bacterium]